MGTRVQKHKDEGVSVGAEPLPRDKAVTRQTMMMGGREGSAVTLCHLSEAGSILNLLKM